METVLKFDKVILTKELNDKIKKVGEVFEIANILDNSFLLRDSKTRVAVGVVSFEDFEEHFVKEKDFKGWTQWTPITGFDGQTDAFYRTNRKKTQVKFMSDRTKGESCLNKEDDFNLYLGVQIAYIRCLNKSLLKQKLEYENKLSIINHNIVENKDILKKMINYLPV